MKRQLLILFALTAALICTPMNSADANGGRGGHGRGGHSRGGHHVRGGHNVQGLKVGFGHSVSFGQGIGGGFGGCGGGLGFGLGGYNDICGYAELYRELYNNLPYFALHPPVYYSHPVPRTYGYSPFAYPPGVMTPEIVMESQPVTILNPHVQQNDKQPVKAEKKSDRTAAISAPVEPLVIVNPFVVLGEAVAHTGR